MNNYILRLYLTSYQTIAGAQGQNRFERAAFMFRKIKALNPKTDWQLIDVENVGHDQRAVARAAQDFLQQAMRKN